MFRYAIARSSRLIAVQPAASRATVARFSVPIIAAVATAAPTHLSLRFPTSAASSRPYSASAGLKKEDVEGRIMTLLQGFDKVNDPSNIKPTAHFANDLGLDSLDTVEVVMAIEEEFGIEIPDKDADGIHGVDKAVEYILSQPDAH